MTCLLPWQQLQVRPISHYYYSINGGNTQILPKELTLLEAETTNLPAVDQLWNLLLSRWLTTFHRLTAPNATISWLFIAFGKPVVWTLRAGLQVL